jgi:hypothetical protein
MVELAVIQFEDTEEGHVCCDCGRMIYNKAEVYNAKRTEHVSADEATR